MPPLVVVLHEADNVATAMAVLNPGDTVISSPRLVTASENIPFGHKVAIQPIKRGMKIVKYGEPIGVAKEDIELGACVHVHNLDSERGRGDKGRNRE